MGRRDRNNGGTNSRASERCKGGEYRTVGADGGRENVWASSDYTGVLKKTSKTKVRCWGGFEKVRHV